LADFRSAQDFCNAAVDKGVGFRFIGFSLACERRLNRGVGVEHVGMCGW
jgi:hypothetical protein